MNEETNGQLASVVIKTPVGRMWMVASGDKLAGAELEPRWGVLAAWIEKKYGVAIPPGKTRASRKAPVLTKAAKALERYFQGKLTAPLQIEIAFDGSGLQRKVWQTVRNIEPGQTITYAELASRARRGGAFRAIGAANAANRCAIFVPCHRVVAGSGALQGYGAGLDAKSWLLAHEGVANDGARVTRKTGER